MRQQLPIDSHVPSILDTVRRHRAAVIVAPPGTGKTTRVPPALVQDGPLILLQPRRVAARSLARWIAAERGWTLGKEIGWQTRLDRRFSPRTRLLVATEGILTARLQGDPLLEGFRTVVLDEFHERSLHADLALALTRQAALARGDLRVVVMSATLEAGPVADYLGGCPIVEVQGRAHPVAIEWVPGASPATAVADVVSRGGGHLLCFLPGVPEIRRVSAELRSSPVATAGVDVHPLHGSLDAASQDAALAPSGRRKVILATNIAETSLTVDGVTDVVDCGLHKVLRRDEGLGIDRLETERIDRDSAEQRAGRAGRTAPGRVVRLWDPRDELRLHREAAIRRVDLAGPFLEVLAWGDDPRRFGWFEMPPADAADAAMELLERLHAVDGGRITDHGRRLRRLPLHPRLATVLLVAGGTPEAAAACAALAEGWRAGEATTATDSDLSVLADQTERAPAGVRRSAESLARAARRILGMNREPPVGGPGPGPAKPSNGVRTERLRRAVLAGYPDRVARRRAPGSRRLLLASGHGAILVRESGVREGEFLVAVDLVAGSRGPTTEALVRLASRVEPAWIEPTHEEIVHELDATGRKVRAVRRARHHELILAEQAVEPDAEHAARMLAERLISGGLGAEAETLLRRARFAGVEIDAEALLRQACHGRTTLPRVDLWAMLPFELKREIERQAPETYEVPSGRRVRLEYRDDGSVIASVKLQELFGLADGPRFGPRAEPLTFALLAPNGRPVQTTRDLRSFWDRTYADVRRQLRGRYPKHPWPEDPWSAEPTARTRRRHR